MLTITLRPRSALAKCSGFALSISYSARGVSDGEQDLGTALIGAFAGMALHGTASAQVHKDITATAGHGLFR
jgi:hypothetical protein